MQVLTLRQVLLATTSMPTTTTTSKATASLLLTHRHWAKATTSWWRTNGTAMSTRLPTLSSAEPTSRLFLTSSVVSPLDSNGKVSTSQSLRLSSSVDMWWITSMLRSSVCRASDRDTTRISSTVGHRRTPTPTFLSLSLSLRRQESTEHLTISLPRQATSASRTSRSVTRCRSTSPPSGVSTISACSSLATTSGSVQSVRDLTHVSHSAVEQATVSTLHLALTLSVSICHSNINHKI